MQSNLDGKCLLEVLRSLRLKVENINNKKEGKTQKLITQDYTWRHLAIFQPSSNFSSLFQKSRFPIQIQTQISNHLKGQLGRPVSDEAIGQLWPSKHKMLPCGSIMTAEQRHPYSLAVSTLLILTPTGEPDRHVWLHCAHVRGVFAKRPWSRCGQHSSSKKGGLTVIKDIIDQNKKKHRKNCKRCPGHCLIVNHYSSMS